MKAHLTIAAAFVLWALAGFQSAARADEYYIYGAVTCDGNRALVRFTGAYNDDDPTFSSPPAEFDHGLSLAPIRDPSTCRLDDGRVVRLRHGSLGDATAYGMNGGVSTEVFTLEIDDQTLFRRAPVWQRGEAFPTLAGLIIDGGSTIECRYGAPIYRIPAPPQTCRDISSEIHSLPAEHYPSPPGALYLDRAAPGRGEFCEGLVAPAPSDGAPSKADVWPVRAPRHAVDQIVDEYRGRESEYSNFDLDNDGHSDRPVVIESQSNYMDAMLWALPPAASIAYQRIYGADAEAFVDSAATRRAQGWRIYGGDETAFSEIRYVTLHPLIRGGTTYLHGRWAIPRLDQFSDLVLLPRPDGGLEEICGFRRAPAL